MRYTEFRAAVLSALQERPGGLTWKELQADKDLPYSRPCPQWTKRLESDIGLERSERRRNALVWKLSDR